MKNILFLVFCLPVYLACGNGLQITRLEVVGADRIRFHVQWEHSWRLEGVQAPYNHDAVWVFIKYREQGGAWQHLDLSPDSSMHTADSLHIQAVSDGKGVFLSRINKGSGTASGTVTLRWKGYLYPAHFDFRIYGIEMVWVPEGSYFLGDGISQSTFRRGDTMMPKFISSEERIPTGTDSTSLNDTGQYAPAGAIPAAYPKGYAGFYCMKYEITQEQYAGFLNTLSYDQQKSRIVAAPESAVGTLVFGNAQSRNGIVIARSSINGQPAQFACDADGNKSFNEADDGQNRACNFLMWNDVMAYLDWAGLRPMTELEFEKVCRGPHYPVQREYAWGTPYATDANTLAEDGTAAEHVTDVPPAGYGLASYGYAGPQGSLRAGFGGTDSSDRLHIGAAYYGALEMSGDLWESCVTVSQQALQFDGSSGDGWLSVSGEANQANWPPQEGSGLRGGGWNSGLSGDFNDLAVSDRFYAGLMSNIRRGTVGGRGCRSIQP